MPQTKHDELKAGLFVIIALAVTLGVILWLGAGDAFRTAGQEVVFYIPEDALAAGIAKGSSIEIAGDEVGRIIDVEYHPDLGRTLYTGRLNTKEITIHADGTAIASSEGLVGGASVAIVSRGTAGAPLADADHAIRITGGMEEAINDLSASAATLREMLDVELDATNPESLRMQVHSILGSLEVTSANMAAMSKNLLAETDATREQSLVYKLHDTLDGVNQVMPRLQDAVEGMANLLARLNVMVAGLNAGEGTLGALLHDARAYRSLLDSLDEMQLMLQDVREAINVWKTTGVPLRLR